MFVHLIIMCLLFFNSLHGLTLHRINEKLGYIEDRINAESKFRREDFRELITEINSLKEMTKTIIETKIEGKETNDHDDTKEDTTKELEEKIFRLTVGLKEEKMINVRLRRETNQLSRHVAYLKTATGKITNVLEKISKGVDTLTMEKKVHGNCFNQFRGKLSELKMNVQNITDNLEQTTMKTEQKLDNLQKDVSNITENIQLLSVKQNLCLEKLDISNDGIFTEDVNDTIDSEENNVCSCSNASVFEQNTPSIEKSIPLYKSCNELYDNGNKINGIYQIDVGEEEPLSVNCDMDTDNRGWTVFQRRQDGSVDFFRDWNAYKNGFGDLNGEFWLGNKYLYILTNDDQQHELRIDLEDFEGNRAYATYRNFKVLSEKMKYKLEVSGYAGNAGDSLAADTSIYGIHNGMNFSTKDADNDEMNDGNCALVYQGGWWFNYCFASHLNGLYSQQAGCILYKCMIWKSLTGFETSLKFTEMKLR